MIHIDIPDFSSKTWDGVSKLTQNEQFVNNFKNELFE